ncbi:MAG: T9SS type A sorting domain-containing protein [Bacteroidota bacterium]
MAMKLTSTTLLLLFIVVNTFAQNPTPNPGFENWSQTGNYFNPDGWNNLNSQTAILGILTCSRVTAAADIHTGTYAMKLTTRSVFGITANGIASTATLITTPPYGVTGGIPYTLRPDSITGWYKYNPASASDSGFFQFVLQGAAGDTIGFVKLCTPNSAVSSYTRFSAPITYFSTATPTNSYWILSSSDGTNPVVNSALFVDDISLVFNPSSSLNTPLQSNQILLPQNPVTDFIRLVDHHGFHSQILDLTGRTLLETQLNSSDQLLDINWLPEGTYILSLRSNDGQFKSARFLKL